MFREMRRTKNQLPREEAVEILKTGSNGILALDGDNGYPYAVPLSYVYDDNKIYFHCTAQGGHKLDALQRNAKVSFCVVAVDDVRPAEFSTLYRSAIAFGHARIVTDREEKQQDLELLTKKYSPDFIEKARETIKAERDIVALVEIQIDHLTGKKGT